MMMTLARVVACGSLASIAAALALGAASKSEGHSSVAPLNATSHWLHGDGAAAREDTDWTHTGVGYATHHSAAIFWAGLFEALRRYSSRSDLSAIARDAVIASTTAAIVDYVFTPHHLTPGWELVLSKRSMALAYLAMAAAFVGSECLLPEREHKRALPPTRGGSSGARALS
jgi:hypothetical protein